MQSIVPSTSLVHLCREMVEEAEDFLAVANPALLRCFEDAERTFSLDKDDLDCSQLATNAYTHDSDSGEESGEESYGETVHLLSRSIRTEDAAEDSTVESFFSETCHCTLIITILPLGNYQKKFH